MSYVPGDCQAITRWPGLASRPVEIGGITVTYAQAAVARATLASSGGIMVRQVLMAAGNPLAGCDYHAAASPYRRLFIFPDGGYGPHQYGRGAAGRPATKQAFLHAIDEELRKAEAAEPARHFAGELGEARDAFGSDAGYAAAMAAAAVQARREAHSARLRALVTSAVRDAVTSCESRRGEFSCAASSACGTGDCRLASGLLTELTVPAGPGRVPRPGNHAQAGRGFGTGPALAELEQAVPFTVGVHVSAAATASAQGAVAA